MVDENRKIIEHQLMQSPLNALTFFEDGNIKSFITKRYYRKRPSDIEILERWELFVKENGVFENRICAVDCSFEQAKTIFLKELGK